VFIFYKSYMYIALVLEVLYRLLCTHNDGIKKKKTPWLKLTSSHDSVKATVG